MANIKKSFNFRNGIQVDEDNLLVTSTGLVGIGTTVPKEALDIVGNVVVSGVTSSVSVKTGIITVTTINPSEIIGAGVSIQSGIITNPSMDNTGIVTYYGDGRYLQGLPTSQWQDTDAGFGVLSIYNTGGTVGIATTNPQFTLQVGDDVNSGQKGVGISSYGDIKASGIITATGFVGNITGNVIGNVTGNADSATLASAATVLQTARNIGGVSFNGSADITLPGVNSSGNQNTSGTATNLSGSPSITVSGVDLNGSLDVSGNTTLGDASSDTLTVNATSTFNQTITGTAGENKIPSLYSTMTNLPSAGSYHGMFAHVHSTGAAYFAHAGNWIELVNKETDGTVGTGTETYSINSLSIGTNSPANDVHLRKSGDTELQITSDTGTAAITVGRESGTSNTNNAEIRYGADSSGVLYSTGQSLDILNYGTHNFNYFLSANDANNVTGDFHWHRGYGDRLMTLTGIGGSLGIGITTPSAKLEVSGDSKFTGSVEITNDLTLTNADITLDELRTLTGDVIGNVTGNLTGLIDTPSVGISTIQQLEVGLGIGIGITHKDHKLNIGSSIDNRIFINSNSQIGIRTDIISESNVTVEILGNVRLKKAVSVGDTTRCAVDFSDAVNISNEGETGLPFDRSQLAYMIPPRVNTSQRDLLRDAHTNEPTLLSGAMVYNTSINKLQVWTGSAWETITSS